MSLGYVCVNFGLFIGRRSGRRGEKLKGVTKGSGSGYMWEMRGQMRKERNFLVAWWDEELEQG